MKLPGGERAVVELSKLRDYCLNPTHPRGRHKARVFAARLGLSAADASFLRDELLRAARDGEAMLGEVDQFGDRYVIDVEIARRERRGMVRSAWIIRARETSPRLTSCYVL
jgi:hypothetical protein